MRETIEREQHLTVIEAIEEVRAGHMVLICNGEDEADLVLAAQFATPEAITFMASHACGLICVALTGERLDALHLASMGSSLHPLQDTAYAISVDVIQGSTTGILANDRSLTIKALVDPTTRPEEFSRPGHVFPLRARPGGILEQQGYTEASVDLMRLAGLRPGAVICEVIGAYGEMTLGRDLLSLAGEWGVGILTVEDIHEYRLQHPLYVSETVLPTADATFNALCYQEIATGLEYLALTLGDLHDLSSSPPLLRIHSACTTGDIFGSQRCDCQEQLHVALKAIAAEGRGLLLYLPQEGRGIGLSAKIQAYALQDQGLDTVEANERLGYPADARTYHTAIDILRDMGITHARLMTNNPRKSQALLDAGIVVERVPIEVPPKSDNIRYLQTKRQKLGHALQLSTH
jgi:3,4-dihydroxy 2-butanone 4-phosphate synthase / GTP cyclohydrolase II